ncbi:MAG: GAF domain-containing protein [Armatimonadota bacterium]|nr:GAF domain-containing protein [Armatimonadota bacterium]
MAAVLPEPRRITFPARLESVAEVRRLVQQVASDGGLSPDECGDLVLAVSEACTNAITHGAGCRPGAQIVVRAYLEPGAVHVEVQDSGSGFDPGALWEPDSETCHGRGLLLMMQLADKVEYAIREDGTRVKLTKYSRVGTAGAREPLPAAGGVRRSRLYYLFDICRAVSGTLDLPQILKVVAESTARLFGVARSRVVLYDPRRQTSSVAAAWGKRLPVPGADHEASDAHRAVYVAEADADRGAGDPSPADGVVCTFISVPVYCRGEAIGSIQLDDFNRPLRFTRSDVAALHAIAAQTGVAIENARLYREVHRRVEELSALGEVARALNSSLDLDQILQTILEKTRELLGVDVCAVMLLDAAGWLSVRASCGLSDRYVAWQHLPLSESPLARALSERRVIAAWDLRLHDAPRGLNEGLVSAAAAPMFLGDRPVGTLNIYTRERHQFSEDEFRILAALAAHAALAVNNARLYEESQQARSQLESSLQQTGDVLDAALGLQDVVRRLAELAAQALGVDGGVLVFSDMGVLVSAGPAALTDENLGAFRLFHQMAQAVAARGRPVSLADVGGEGASVAAGEAGIAAALAVPVPARGAIQGALCVYSRSPRPLGAREVALLSAFAAQAGMVIENQCLLQDAHLRLEQLGTLLEVGQSIVSKLDLDSVLDRIIRHVSRLTDAEVCSILLRDPQSGELYVAASHGMEASHARRLRVPDNEGVIGEVLRDGCPRAVADIRHHTAYVYREVGVHRGLRALLCAPLKRGEEVIGVLNVYRASAHTWSDAEVKFLSALGTQAAIAIQNATRYQQEHHMARALQKAFVPEHPPRIPGLEIGQVYAPAGDQEEVGGDFYDFIPLDGGQLGIVIADVSGKGIRAATATAMGKYLVRAYLLENPSPADVVTRANRALYLQLKEDTGFLTLVYALWEDRQRQLVYVNAGHPYPLLWRRATGEIQALRSPHTMMLGVMPDLSFTEKRVEIHEGDLLLAYTDGVIEARRGHEQFGAARLESALRETAHLPPQAIVDEIYRRVRQFQNNHWKDDVTLLAVRFLR